jgi:opacity protein-like surface antigen
MKKILLVATATLFLATAAVAQTPTGAGKLFLNAEISGLDVNITPSPFALGVAAGGGYFVIDNLAVRALLAVDFTGGVNGGDSNINLGFGVGGRYYLSGFFLDALLVGANSGRNENFEKKLEFGIGAALGYAIFLNDYVAFEPALNINIPFAEGRDVNVGLSAAFSIYF